MKPTIIVLILVGLGFIIAGFVNGSTSVKEAATTDDKLNAMNNANIVRTGVIILAIAMLYPVYLGNKS